MQFERVDLISKTELYRRLRDAGYEPSDDRIDRLRRARLIDPFVRDPAGGPERFATSEHVARLFVVYGTIARLGLTKPQAAEIAYWLSANGHRVPPKLVAAHLRRSVNSVVASLWRELGRRLDLALWAPPPDAPSRIARSVWGALRRLAPSPPTPIVADLGYVVLRAWAGVTFRNENFAAASGLLRRCLEPLLGLDNATKYSRPLWEAIVEFASLITTNDNQLIAATASAEREEPEEILLAAWDSRLLCDEFTKVFPAFGDPEILRRGPWNFDDENTAIVMRYFPPLIAALLMWSRPNEYSTTFREHLRSGDVGDLHTELLQAKAMLERLFPQPPTQLKPPTVESSQPIEEHE